MVDPAIRARLVLRPMDFCPWHTHSISYDDSSRLGLRLQSARGIEKWLSIVPLSSQSTGCASELCLACFTPFSNLILQWRDDPRRDPSRLVPVGPAAEELPVHSSRHRWSRSRNRGRSVVQGGVGGCLDTRIPARSMHRRFKQNRHFLDHVNH